MYLSRDLEDAARNRSLRSATQARTLRLKLRECSSFASYPNYVNPSNQSAETLENRNEIQKYMTNPKTASKYRDTAREQKYNVPHRSRRSWVGLGCWSGTTEPGWFWGRDTSPQESTLSSQAQVNCEAQRERKSTSSVVTKKRQIRFKINVDENLKFSAVMNPISFSCDDSFQQGATPGGDGADPE